MKEKFEWDEKKNRINIKKHGVSFVEAEDAFDDPNAVYDEDDEHSFEEERFIIIGKSKKNSRLLYVCYCERENDEKIRIISARKAVRLEKDIYLMGGY
jgi:hypothetical protein